MPTVNVNAANTPSPRQYVARPAPRLSASGNPVSNTDDDQPILMEAKLVETIGSLRQLILSNQQLEEALRECHDQDLMEALEENDGVISRKRDAAKALAAKLSRHGVYMGDKIPRYDGSALLKRANEQRQRDDENSGGLHL